MGDAILRQKIFTRTDSIGFYLQDQISLTNDLILALGGRFAIAGVKIASAIAQIALVKMHAWTTKVKTMASMLL